MNTERNDTDILILEEGDIVIDDSEEEDNIQVILNSSSPARKIQDEIENLIRQNTILPKAAAITIHYNQSFIKISPEAQLSYELQLQIWGQDTKMTLDLPNQNLFEITLLNLPHEEQEIVGFLGAFYLKNGSDKAFKELSLVVIKESKILGFSTFSQNGSMKELLEMYKPKKIFYKLDDAQQQFLSFLNYKYTPFYIMFKDVNLIPLKPGLSYKNYNTHPYCPTSNVFCSLCSALKLILSVFNKDIQAYTKSKTGILKREQIKRITGKPLVNEIKTEIIHNSTDGITVSAQPMAFTKPVFLNANRGSINQLESFINPPKYYYSTPRLGNPKRDELRLRLHLLLSAPQNKTLTKASVKHLTPFEQEEFYKINRWLNKNITSFIYRKILYMYILHGDEFKSLVSSIV
jgi:hypothetical protein